MTLIGNSEKGAGIVLLKRVLSQMLLLLSVNLETNSAMTLKCCSGSGEKRAKEGQGMNQQIELSFSLTLRFSRRQ